MLDSGARGSTITFAQRGIGDVLLAWENEAYYLVEEMGKNKFEIVTPTISILAEPPVAVVDKNVDKHGTRAVAEAYLKFLYTPEGQEIAAKHHYRPRDQAVVEAPRKQLREGTLFTIDGAFGGWQKAQKTHFADGGSSIRSTSQGHEPGAVPPHAFPGQRPRTAACCPGSGSRSASRSPTWVFVLIPLAGLAFKSADLGWAGFWRRSRRRARWPPIA